MKLRLYLGCSRLESPTPPDSSTSYKTFPPVDFVVARRFGDVFPGALIAMCPSLRFPFALASLCGGFLLAGSFHFFKI